MLIYATFFRENETLYEFIVPDIPSIFFNASSIEEGMQEAKIRILQEIQTNKIKPTNISIFLKNENLQNSSFFLIEIDSNDIEDIIEKVTITFPRSRLNQIEAALLKNPTLKSRSGFLLKAAEDLLKKENDRGIIKDFTIPSLNSLTKHSPAYYLAKFAYTHKFIEYAKSKSRNYIDLLIHNLTENDIRNNSIYSFPLEGDRISLKDEVELEHFLKYFEENYTERGFNISKKKFLENGRLKYWLFQITWDSNTETELLETNIKANDYTWCEDFVKYYLKSIGFSIVSDQ